MEMNYLSSWLATAISRNFHHLSSKIAPQNTKISPLSATNFVKSLTLINQSSQQLRLPKMSLFPLPSTITSKTVNNKPAKSSTLMIQPMCRSMRIQLCSSKGLFSRPAYFQLHFHTLKSRLGLSIWKEYPETAINPQEETLTVVVVRKLRQMRILFVNTAVTSTPVMLSGNSNMANTILQTSKRNLCIQQESTTPSPLLGAIYLVLNQPNALKVASKRTFPVSVPA